jgi:hypothetical protein
MRKNRYLGTKECSLSESDENHDLQWVRGEIKGSYSRDVYYCSICKTSHYGHWK